MRFVVSRTSEFGLEAPCPEAFRGSVPHWNMRTFKSPEEFDAKLAHMEGPWRSKGSDHAVVRDGNGNPVGIKRRMGTKDVWLVEIADLPALMAFCAKHGPLVLSVEPAFEDAPAIEIYDDYRE